MKVSLNFGNRDMTYATRSAVGRPGPAPRAGSIIGLPPSGRCDELVRPARPAAPSRRAEGVGPRAEFVRRDVAPGRRRGQHPQLRARPVAGAPAPGPAAAPLPAAPEPLGRAALVDHDAGDGPAHPG